MPSSDRRDDNDVASPLGSLSLSSAVSKCGAARTSTEAILHTSKCRSVATHSPADGTGSAPLQISCTTVAEDQRGAAAPSIALRDYQAALAAAIGRRYEAGHASVLAYLPTGGGKTHVAAFEAATELICGGSVLVLF